jgi:hypothetical protein
MDYQDEEDSRPTFSSSEASQYIEYGDEVIFLFALVLGIFRKRVIQFLNK